MRILIATPMYPPEIGYRARYIRDLALRLHAAAYEVTVVAYATTSEHIPGITLKTASKRRALPLRMTKFLHLLWSSVRSGDCIYAQNAMVAGLPAVIVSRLTRVPVIIHFAQDEAWERAVHARETTACVSTFLENPSKTLRSRVFVALQRWVVRHAHHITVPFPHLRDLLTTYYNVPPERISILPLPLYPLAHVPFPPSVRTSEHLYAAGRLLPWKGFSTLIAALPLVRAELPDVRLTIAGSGPDEARLLSLATEKGVREHVSFLGHISDAEHAHHIRTCAIYVAPHTCPDTPYNLLSAAAHGVPTVSTTHSTESVVHYPPDNNKALAKALIATLSSPPQKEVGELQRSVRHTYTWETHVAELTRLFAAHTL